MKHGVPRRFICPWCLRSFRDASAVDAHSMAKHFRSMPVIGEEEDRVRRKMKDYDRDRKRGLDKA